jgi:hypothetical protein
MNSGKTVQKKQSFFNPQKQLNSNTLQFHYKNFS